jgi:hypothetical protein
VILKKNIFLIGDVFGLPDHGDFKQFHLKPNLNPFIDTISPAGNQPEGFPGGGQPENCPVPGMPGKQLFDRHINGGFFCKYPIFHDISFIK